MATITLKAGDFGSGVPVNVGSETLYLPDREHPGLTLAVPIADLVEMDSVDGDALKPVKQALKAGAKGLFVGPAGLAAGFRAATKVRDIEFTATLSDGRRFTAVTDAKSYANLHAAQLAARSAAMRGGDAADDMPHPADEIIAKYLEAAKSAPADPPPAKPSPEPPSERRSGERRQGERRQPPTFGRRRS